MKCASGAPAVFLSFSVRHRYQILGFKIGRGCMIIRLFHLHSIDASNTWTSTETVRIFADKKPFTVAESFHADAKYYFESVEKVHKPKAIIYLNQISQNNMLLNLCQASKFISIYQVVREEKGTQYSVSWINHLLTEVQICRRLYLLWFNKKKWTRIIEVFVYDVENEIWYPHWSILMRRPRPTSPFERALSQEQLKGLHEDQPLIEKR